MEAKTIIKLNQLSRLGRADLHIHSNYSDGKPTIKQILDYAERKTDLDIIAITDHDTIEGALKAQKIVEEKKYRVKVIVGEEVSCIEGHVIGLFLKKAIEPGLEAKIAIKKIKAQGGLVMMPHPLRHVRANTGKENTDGVGFMVLIKEKKRIDALEGINATPTQHKDNLSSMFFNDTLMYKAEVGGSDAHILEAVGMGFTIFEGKNSRELRKAILTAQTRAVAKDWKWLALFKYLFFFLPKGFRLFVNTILHGRRPKRIQVANIPKNRFEAINKKIRRRSIHLKSLKLNDRPGKENDSIVKEESDFEPSELKERV